MATWKHSESRGFNGAIATAIARWSTVGTPLAGVPPPRTSTDNEVRDIRALMIGTFGIVDSLSGRPPTVRDDTVFLGPRGEGDFAAASFVGGFGAPEANVLQATWQVLAAKLVEAGVALPPDAANLAISTADASPAEPLNLKEAGYLVQAIGIVAGFTAATIGVVFIAQKTAELIDRQLSRSEETQRMVATHARVMAIFDAHSTAEKVAGKPLPLTDVERSVLAQLSQAQDVASKAQSALPTPIPTGAQVSSAVGSVGSGLFGLVALGIAAYFGYEFLTSRRTA